MDAELNDNEVSPMVAADRIGFARLTRMAFNGIDLGPLWRRLMDEVADGSADAGCALDLSLIAQLLGERETGLLIQTQAIVFHQLYRSPCAANPPRLRVLALAADIDMGGNMPIEFLLEESGIELQTLYVIDGMKLPDRLPDHDIAIVIASDSEESQAALRIIDRAAAGWPRPLLNPPHLVGNLDRDKLYRLLRGIEGLDIPAIVNMTRGQLSDVAASKLSLPEILHRIQFPLIVRPRGSHAGVGLARLDDCGAIERYLADRPEQDFFVSRFVDYASEDGLFRKYRVVFIEGRPFACHMAIANRWDIWYLNAGMSESAAKRLEEETFMRTFDAGFARRHQAAMAEMAARIGLDYFTIDCAENKQGELLLFEADNTAVVHNMDSPFVFPYKPPQMHVIFEAFTAMLHRASRRGRREQAA
jgi:hypothetical protein